MSRQRRSLVLGLGLVLLIALSAGVVSLASATPVPPKKQGPVASYSFDEGAGTTVHDLSGDANEGTVEGATWARGKYGSALEFDGNTTCVSVPDSETLQLEEEFTLEAWVRPEGTLGDEPLIFKEAEGGPSYVMGIGFGAGGKLEGWAEGEEIASPHYIEDNAWVHLAFTYDGNRMRLFEDGELVANKLVGSETMGSANPLRIGCWPGHEYAEARIDEVRVYERALGAGEIALDMDTPLETPKVGPVADWSFDEGSGTTAADDTGDGHTVTLNKATWARGRFGNALKFDGKKSCASAAASPELDFSEEFTLEAWVRPESEGLHSILAQEDEAAGGGEDPFAYTLLSGDEKEEGPRIWVRKSAGGRSNAGGPPIPEGAWSHLAVTDDGAQLHFYVDGQLVGTGSAEPPTTGNGPLAIGCIALYGDHFKGRIDEVRAYDRVLTGAEVDADMEAPIQTPKTGPVAAYSFDEGEAGGTSVQDVTGDGHTATIHGAKWSTQGVYGGALEFDAAEEDFVSIPASTGLDGIEQLTVEAWVRPTESPEWASILMKERETGPGYSYALYQHYEQTSAYFQETEEHVLISPEESLPQGAWTHLAITDDGAWSRLYVNGDLVDTEPAVSIEGHGEIRIGGNSIWGEYFDGRIDEVRIYDRALDEAEIHTDADTPLQTPEKDPVAEYSFDAGTGSTLADLSGHENNGAIEGATWTPNGKYGSALEFNGSSDCVKVPNSESLQLGEEFTLEAWVRPEGPLTEDPIFFKENDPELGFWEIPSYWMYVGFNATGKPQGYNEGAMVTGPNAIHDDTWTHLAFTYDGHALHVYVNGELEASNPISELAMSSKGPLYIGCSPAYEEFFHGRIDEARIYERALGWSEVKASAEIPIQTPRSGPIAAWSFDEGEGTAAEDVTGNGHEATLEGGPTWTKGKYGDALDFNGSTEKCAKVPDSPSLQLREDFTIEAWVKPEYTPSYDPIIWKETGSAASYTLAIGLQGGEKAEAYIGEEEGASYERVVSPASIEQNVWTHIAATYDGVHLRLYVNGELVASKYTTTPNMESSGPLYIGCAPDFGDWFGGRIDEPRIYERALNQPEVAASMGPLPSAQTAETYATGESETIFTARINPQGLPTTYRFQYGLTTAYGQTVPEPPEETEEPVIADEPIEVEEWVGELEPETTYHYRVIATNASGTVVGQDRTVTTEAAPLEMMAMLTGKEKEEKEKAEEKREEEVRKAWPGAVGNNWNGDLSEPAKLVERLSASGTKIFRVPIGSVDPGNTDLLLRLAKAHIKVLPNLVGIPGFQPRFNEFPAVKPGSPARMAWEEHLENLVKAYGPEGTLWTGEGEGVPWAEYAPEFWEIWNEPNYTSTGAFGARTIGQKAWAERYGDLLEAAHAAITKVDHKAKILFGGVLTVGKWNEEIKKQEPHMTVGAFIRQVAHYSDYDALSLHPYSFSVNGHAPQPGKDVEQLTKKIKKNISIARGAMEDVRKHWEAAVIEGGGTLPAETKKPIWITELGWPVEGPKVENDRHHLLVSEKAQKALLNASFNMMKGNSGTAKREFNLANLLYYNIEDNTHFPALPSKKELEEMTPEKRRETEANYAAAKKGAENWANHCGLLEATGGLGNEKGKQREAWSAFVNQAK